jgi:hypothetical protein
LRNEAVGKIVRQIDGELHVERIPPS